MSITAMKQALEAFEDFVDDPRAQEQINASITALRQAIAEAEKREWVGLTDEEIEHIEETTTCYGEESWLRNLTRNIEAKLKEKNHG